MKKIFIEILPKILDNYEYREEQIIMAESVENAIKNKKTLIIEAGTGVGKTIGYLLPCVIYALKEEKKAIISTYSKALQQQIYKKDILFIKKIYPELKYSVIFGSANYLCKRRMKNFSNKDELFKLSEFKDILDFLKTKDGVRENLKFYFPDDIWSEINRDNEFCLDENCEYFKKCYYFNIKRKLKKSQIIIVNHHLLFSDIKAGRKILPEADILVFDEAHKVEDVIRDIFTDKFSSFSFFRFLKIIEDFFKDYLEINRKTYLYSFIINLKSEINDFLKIFQNKKEEFFLFNYEVKNKIEIKSNFSDLIFELEKLLKSKITIKQKRLIKYILNQIENYSEILKRFMERNDKKYFYWVEKNEKNINLNITPYDVRNIYQEYVDESFKSIIFTSATLSVDKNFEYIKNQFNLRNVDEKLLYSPFDFKKQSILYLENRLPSPGEEEFEEKLFQRICEIISITKGGTMILFTNILMMKKIYNNLKNCIKDIPIFIQGEKNSMDLISEFKNKNGILLATYSFWQGVDIKGDALRCVVIVRLPFEMPEHPIQKAICEDISRNGGDHFFEYSLPRAVFMLKQGFGRLIRSKEDYGVVMILDKRIINKNYGKKFLNSLPETLITSDLEIVKNFLDSVKKSV